MSVSVLSLSSVISSSSSSTSSISKSRNLCIPPPDDKIEPDLLLGWKGLLAELGTEKSTGVSLIGSMIDKWLFDESVVEIGVAVDNGEFIIGDDAAVGTAKILDNDELLKCFVLVLIRDKLRDALFFELDESGNLKDEFGKFFEFWCTIVVSDVVDALILELDIIFLCCAGNWGIGPDGFLLIGFIKDGLFACKWL